MAERSTDNSGKLNAYEVSDISQTRNLTAVEHAAFRAFLRDEHGTNDLPAAVDDALFSKAWEMGHSSGYHEVQYTYGELADLVLLAYRAN